MNKSLKSLLAAACASSGILGAAHAQTPVSSTPIKTVWYILLENRNFTAGTDTSGGSVVKGNSAAPYINALISGSSSNTAANAAALQCSWCSCYHNVLATPSGANPSIHPSEPNYVWMECGNNLSKADDNDPYGSGNSVNQIYSYLAANPSLSGQHLSGLMQAAGVTWRNYQEGVDQANTVGGNFNNGGTLTTGTVAQSLWTVPLNSFSGTSSSYVNPYNGSHQYNFAAKHDGDLFFLDTNGSSLGTGAANANISTSNPYVLNYAPLPQLQTDLNNGACAQYNIITPDQYNDMHTALSSPGFTYRSTAANGNIGTGSTYTGDLAQVAQGDNFLATVIPQIMASSQYQNGGCIVVWTDETEGTNQNDFNHTLTEFIISPYAKGGGYNSTVNMTHSTDIATMQEIFGLVANTPSGYLNDAANMSNSSGALAGSAPGFGTAVAQDMSDLFQPGVIPSGLPFLQIAPGGYTINSRAHTATQTVTVNNISGSAITNPVYLVIANSNATVTNQGVQQTQNTAPVGSPYVVVSSNGIPAGGSASVLLHFSTSSGTNIVDTLSAITTAGQP